MSDEISNRDAARILIAEDEAIVAEDLALTVQDLGYQLVGTASTGLLAIELAEKSQPSLILMDIKLAGEIDGIEASEQIRARFDIPVIFLTAYEEADVVSRAKLIEPYGFLAKPFSYHILKTTIETALYKHAADKRMRESEERYRTLVEQSIDGIVLIQGRTVRFVNPALAKMFGFQSKEEAEGRDFSTFVAPEYRDLMEKRGGEREEGKPVPECYEFTALRKDGSPFTAEVRVNLTTYQGDKARQGIVRDISERKKLEESLKKSQQMLSLAIEGANLGIWDWNLTTGEALWSERFYRMLGYSPNEFESNCRNWSKFVHADDWPAVADTLNLHLQGKLPEFEVVYRAPNKSGGWQWLQVQGTVTEFDSDGKPTRITGVVADITERKLAEEAVRRARDELEDRVKESTSELLKANEQLRLEIAQRKRSEDALRSSEERYRDLVENLNDIIFSTDEQGFLTYVSPPVRDMLGYEASDLVGKHFSFLVYQEDLASITKSFQDVLNGELYSSDYRLLTKSGDWRRVRTSSRPIVKHGKILGIQGVATDITEGKKAEEALRTSEAQLSNAVIMAHLGHWEYDVAKDMFTFNDHFYKIFRTTAGQVGGYTMSSADYARKFVHPDDISVVADETRKAIETSDPFFSRQLEHRMLYADGEIGHIAVRFFIVKDSTGRTIKTYGVNQDITERKGAEEAIRKSEERLELALQGGDLGWWDFHVPTGQTFSNERAVGIVGYSLNEISDGMNFWESILHPDDRQRVLEHLQDRLAGIIDSSEIEYRVRHKNGDWRWVLSRGKTTELDPYGKPVRMTGTFLDITEKKLAEIRAAESSELRDRIFSDSPVGVAVYRADGQCVSANEALGRMVGADEGLLLTQNFRDLASWKDSGLLANADRVLSGAIDNQREFQVTTTFGKSLWVDARMALLTSGGERHLLLVFNDITDRKNAEEALRKSEALLNSIIEQSPFSMWISDNAGTLTRINPACKKWVRVTDEDVVGIYNVLKDEAIEAQGFMPMVRRVFENGEQANFELVWESTLIRHLRHKQAFKLILAVTIFPVKDAEGRITNAVCQHIDITERKEVQERLRESEEQYRAVFENAGIGINLLDRDGRIVKVNQALLNIVGRSEDELREINFLDITHPDDREISKRKLKALLTGEIDSYRLEKRYVREDGGIVWVDLWSCGLRDSNGRHAGTVAVIADITERKKAEEQVRSQGTLLGAINSVLREALESDSDADIARTCLRVAEDITGSKFGFVGEINQTGHMDTIAFSDPGWSECQMDKADIPRLITNMEIRGIWASVLKEGCSQIISDPVSHPYSVGLPKGHVPLTSFMGVPLKRSGETFGLIALANKDKGYEPSDVADMEAVSEAFVEALERKRAERALQVSEEKYRSVVENMQDVFYRTDMQGTITMVSPSGAQTLGYDTIEQLIGLNVVRDFYKAPIERDRLLADLKEKGKVSDFEVELVRRDGDSVIVSTNSHIYYDKSGQPLGIEGVFTDITRRKKAEHALRESEEWHRSFVENSFDGIFVQQDGKVIYASSRLYQMLGYSPGELEGIEHWRVYYGKYQQITRERAEARMRGENVPPQYEVMLQRKDGSLFEGEVSARVVTIKDRPAVQAWVKDISKRKRLEEVQRRLATVIEQSADAIVITDTRGIVEYVNPAHERITGYTPEEVIGSLAPVLKERKLNPELYKNLTDALVRGSTWSGRTVGRRKDGTLYDMDRKVSPVRDPNGKIVNFVGLERDVTQEVRLQQQLRQAQKMEAIGTLAGGVAHDFNNLLTVVQGFSELLLDEKDQKHPDYADLKKIFHAAESGAELVKQLLMFSRKSEPTPVPMNLNKQIVQVEKLLRRTIPKMIEIRLDLSSDLPDINADPSQVEQVLMNLAVNARDAMPDGGKLIVRTSAVTLDDEYCSHFVGAKPGEYALLEISDTGHGMDKETVEHVFEPFFTTKEIGRGTGLGLATVYGIVSQHNGHITVYSEVGKGTIFKVYLPAMPGDVEPDVEASSIMFAFGTETILLVDDEEFVRELGARILTKQGYTVLQAKNGKQALDLFRKERSRISLVILDLIMPEMGGAECLKELLKIDPKVKVIIASGFSADASVKETIQLGAKGFVNKPFRVNKLLRGVRKVLDEG